MSKPTFKWIQKHNFLGWCRSADPVELDSLRSVCLVVVKLNLVDVLLSQVGSPRQFLTFTLWWFSPEKKSHCGARTFLLSPFTYSGINLLTAPTPAASHRCSVLKSTLRWKKDLKMLNSTWHPTKQTFSWASNRWMLQTQGSTSVDMVKILSGGYSVQHIYKLKVRDTNLFTHFVLKLRHIWILNLSFIEPFLSSGRVCWTVLDPVCCIYIPFNNHHLSGCKD